VGRPQLVVFTGAIRATPFGVSASNGTPHPGLRDIRFTHVAPPWADLGPCLRHYRSRNEAKTEANWVPGHKLYTPRPVFWSPAMSR